MRHSPDLPWAQKRHIPELPFPGYDDAPNAEPLPVCRTRARWKGVLGFAHVDHGCGDRSFPNRKAARRLAN